MTGSGPPDGPGPGCVSGAVDVVAIDGPSGSGKSTVARLLARKLGFAYLDTGAMYRAVTWRLLAAGAPLEDRPAVAGAVAGMDVRMGRNGVVLVDGGDCTGHLRTREVDAWVSHVSALPEVRLRMTTLQRSMAGTGPLVAEGRDMATVVFPHARWKFYLDARPEERARRRRVDFEAAGRRVSQEEVREEMEMRDLLDSSRPDAPLRRAADAVCIDTTSLAVEEVVERMAGIVERSSIPEKGVWGKGVPGQGGSGQGGSGDR